MKARFLAVLLTVLAATIFAAEPATRQKLPSKQLQGDWVVDRHYFSSLREGASDFENRGPESPKGKFAPTMELRFRLDRNGAMQRVWTDRSGTVIQSKGITVLKSAKTSFAFRPWSDHPDWQTTLTLNDDGTGILQVRSLKHQETFLLRRGDDDDR